MQLLPQESCSRGTAGERETEGMCISTAQAPAPAQTLLLNGFKLLRVSHPRVVLKENKYIILK